MNDDISSEEENRNTAYFVTKLVDYWNVGIKTGYIDVECHEYEKVKKYMSSVGITVYIEYEWRNSSSKFVMIKTSEADVIPNPLHK